MALVGDSCGEYPNAAPHSLCLSLERTSRMTEIRTLRPAALPALKSPTFKAELFHTSRLEEPAFLGVKREAATVSERTPPIVPSRTTQSSAYERGDGDHLDAKYHQVEWRLIDSS